MKRYNLNMRRFCISLEILLKDLVEKQVIVALLISHEV